MALSMHLFTLMTQVNNAPEAIVYGTAVVLIGLVLAVNSALDCPAGLPPFAKEMVIAR